MSSTTNADRLRNYSGKNMVYSLLAVLALAFGWWALMPSPEELQRRPVDVDPVASYAAAESNWPVWVPEGLGEGWTPTSVNYQERADVVTWRMGWVTPSAQWIGLEQAGSATQEWREAVLPGAEQTGQVSLPTPAGPATWTQWRTEDEHALLLAPQDDGAATVVVHGTASPEEMAEFVGSLRVEDPSQD